MKQLITRIDDQLAADLKRQATRNHESVNALVTRLLRLAVNGSGSPRHQWKVAALADGRLSSRGVAVGEPTAVLVSSRVESGYSARVLSEERDKE